MFTILENYKTLMRMCMSADMAGVEAGKSSQLEADINKAIEDFDLSQKDIDDLRLAGYSDEQIVQGLEGKSYMADTEMIAKLKENKEGVVAKARGAEISYAQNTQTFPNVTIPASIPATYVTPTTPTTPVTSNENRVTGTWEKDGQTYVTLMMDGQEINVSQADFNTYYSSKVQNTASSSTTEYNTASIDNTEYSAITDAYNNSYEINVAAAKDISQFQDPYTRPKGETYAFNVNGTTEYAVWIDVIDKFGNICPTFVKPVKFVEGPGTEPTFFVCDGPHCVTCAEPVQPVDAPRVVQTTPIPAPYVAPPAPAYVQPAPTPDPSATFVPPVIPDGPMLGNPEFLCDGVHVEGKYALLNTAGEEIYYGPKRDDGTNYIFKITYGVNGSRVSVRDYVAIPNDYKSHTDIVAYLSRNSGIIRSDAAWRLLGTKEEVCNIAGVLDGGGTGNAAAGGMNAAAENASAPSAGGTAGNAAGNTSF